MKLLLLYLNITKHHFLAYFDENKEGITFQFFDQNHGLTSLEQSKIMTLRQRFLYNSIKVVLNLNIIKHHCLAYFNEE